MAWYEFDTKVSDCPQSCSIKATVYRKTDKQIIKTFEFHKSDIARALCSDHNRLTNQDCVAYAYDCASAWIFRKENYEN